LTLKEDAPHKDRNYLERQQIVRDRLLTFTLDVCPVAPSNLQGGCDAPNPSGTRPSKGREVPVKTEMRKFKQKR
jgi:hypothetical protein